MRTAKRRHSVVRDWAHDRVVAAIDHQDGPDCPAMPQLSGERDLPTSRDLCFDRRHAFMLHQNMFII